MPIDEKAVFTPRLLEVFKDVAPAGAGTAQDVKLDFSSIFSDTGLTEFLVEITCTGDFFYRPVNKNAPGYTIPNTTAESGALAMHFAPAGVHMVHLTSSKPFIAYAAPSEISAVRRS